MFYISLRSISWSITYSRQIYACLVDIEIENVEKKNEYTPSRIYRATYIAVQGRPKIRLLFRLVAQSTNEPATTVAFFAWTPLNVERATTNARGDTAVLDRVSHRVRLDRDRVRSLALFPDSLRGPRFPFPVTYETLYR